MLLLDENRLRRMVYGGAILGAGGGGSIAAGMRAGRDALAAGKPRLATLSELPEDARLVTLSGVGPVGKIGGGAQPVLQHGKALALFLRLEKKPVAGLIASEVGPTAVTYGWRESALTGTPVVDAPCNGRAHPLGVMGSLNLHRIPTHAAALAAVGGEPGTANYLELALRASVQHGARIVRGAVAQMGASLAVVRNPVSARYARQHAAVGALAEAGRIGRILLAHRTAGLETVLHELCASMGGKVIARGVVKTSALVEHSGFTIGTLVLRTHDGRTIRLPVCNEFMMVLSAGATLAAFPDLITVFDARTALPLNSAAVQPEQRVAVFAVPRRRLKLGTTMHDRSLLRPIETLLKVRFPTIRQTPAPARAVSMR